MGLPLEPPRGEFPRSPTGPRARVRFNHFDAGEISRGEREGGREEAMDGGAGRPHHPRRLAAASMAMVGGAAVPAGGTSFGNAPRGETKVIPLSSRVIACNCKRIARFLESSYKSTDHLGIYLQMLGHL